MGSTSSLYAAIDLGSNSFHMLVVREVEPILFILQSVSALAAFFHLNHLLQ